MGLADMKRRAKRPFPLGEILENFFGRSGLKARLTEQRVLDSWRKAVGKGIGEQTQPIRIQNRILQVRVSNSVWMQQLQFMKGMILSKIKEETGMEDLEDLRFFIGEVEGGEGEDGIAEHRPGGEEEAKGWEKLSDAEMTRIRREVDALADPELRKIFESIFARSFAMGKTLRNGGK
jgi:hypothetical protein